MDVDGEVTVLPPTCLLYDWCKKIPCMCVLEDFEKFEVCSLKHSLVLNASSSTFLFDDLRSVLNHIPQLEFLEVRFFDTHNLDCISVDSCSSELLQCNAVPRMLILPHCFISKYLQFQFQPIAGVLRVSVFSRQLAFDATSLATVEITIDDCSPHLINRMKETRISQHVRTLSVASACACQQQLKSLLLSCLNIETLRFIVKHNHDKKLEWSQLQLANVLHVNFTSYWRLKTIVFAKISCSFANNCFNLPTL
jgi:hypothetical protein